MSRHLFRDLSTVIDSVHALVDGWVAAGTLAPALDADSAEVLRLALHEWIANLVQHATFPRGVEIALEVEPGPESVFCAVEDTSAGFDFAGQIDRQQAILDAPAPSERGRGLLMLMTCTDDLSFVTAADGRRQRISFHVRHATAAPLLASLFRPEDLSSEPDAFGDAFGDTSFGGDTFDASAPPYSGDGLDADRLSTLRSAPR